VLAVSLAIGLAGLATSTGAAAGVDEPPPYHPSRLSHLGDARQVVVVTSSSWSTSYATLRAYQRKASGGWRLRIGPVDARVGYNGFSLGDRRRQGNGTTPAGTYAIPWAFGTEPDPGTDLPYRDVDANDWWPYDPRDASTYNVWQPRRTATARWRTSWAEDLSSPTTCPPGCAGRAASRSPRCRRTPGAAAASSCT
jgi:L,D-peptidoglycan transpeptidase YkuD (ErfK/YbiS/YcfS/YnhG family)